MKFIYLFLILLNSGRVYAKLVKYEFDINTKVVRFTDKQVQAIAIQNQIPGPTIEARVGDVLQVTFHNKMNVETSIHWHGVLLPNDQDGVPYLTTQPIAPRSSFTYRYKVTHSGTYWYHSHTGLQEQRGVYGSIVFYSKSKEKVQLDKDYVVVLSDWTDEDPKTVLSNLKKDGDYYALKKKSVISWDRILIYGKQAITNRLQGAWSRMGPMDISDVGYDAFLSNGKKEEYLEAKSGDHVRVRLINAAASSYFHVEFAESHMTLVASDGVDIEPIQVKRLRIAIGETYDLILPIHQNKSYELRATSEDGTGYSSTFIGVGEKVFARDIPKPNLFLAKHDSHYHHKSMKNSESKNHQIMKHSSKSFKKKLSVHHKTDHSNLRKEKSNKLNKPSEKKTIEYMADYENLRSIKDTSFDSQKPKREIVLNLNGNMEDYIWSFNNKTLAESDTIKVKKGEVVRFILQNQTMMHHPLHLHGHFFRVLNKQGHKSPLKHTVNVPAMGKVVIEFEADKEKDWLFHCHNLYHMKTGMTRVISYEGSSQATPEILNKISKQPWYFYGETSLLSNMFMGEFRFFNTRTSFEFDYDGNYKKEYELEAVYVWNKTQFFDIYIGGHTVSENKAKQLEHTAIIGMRYVLPLLIELDFQIDSRAHIKLEFRSDLQLTQRTKFYWVFNTDKEYNLSLIYELNKRMLIHFVYDSDFKWGSGLQLSF